MFTTIASSSTTSSPSSIVTGRPVIGRRVSVIGIEHQQRRLSSPSNVLTQGRRVSVSGMEHHHLSSSSANTFIERNINNNKCCPVCKSTGIEDVCTACGTSIPGTSRPPIFADTPSVAIVTNQPNNHTPQHQQQHQQQQMSKYVNSYTPVKKEYHSKGDNSMAVRVGDRLIYDFEKWPYGCFETGTGIDPQVKHEIPTELSSKGVLAEQWYDWMSELAQLQKLAPSELGTQIMFCVPGIFVQALLCTLFCPISMNHCFSSLPCCHGDWYEELRKWLKNVNNILNEYGMHAKFATYKPPSSAPKSKEYHLRMESRGYRYGYEMSFLVIALTPEESKVLQDDSWDHGVYDCLISGIGRVV